MTDNDRIHSQLETMAFDALVLIVAWLDTKSIVRLSMVSRSMHETISASRHFWLTAFRNLIVSEHIIGFDFAHIQTSSAKEIKGYATRPHRLSHALVTDTLALDTSSAFTLMHDPAPSWYFLAWECLSPFLCPGGRWLLSFVHEVLPAAYVDVRANSKDWGLEDEAYGHFYCVQSDIAHDRTIIMLQTTGNHDILGDEKFWIITLNIDADAGLCKIVVVNSTTPEKVEYSIANSMLEGDLVVAVCRPDGQLPGLVVWNWVSDERGVIELPNELRCDYFWLHGPHIYIVGGYRGDRGPLSVFIAFRSLAHLRSYTQPKLLNTTSQPHQYP